MKWEHKTLEQIKKRTEQKNNTIVWFHLFRSNEPNRWNSNKTEPEDNRTEEHEFKIF